MKEFLDKSGVNILWNKIKSLYILLEEKLQSDIIKLSSKIKDEYIFEFNSDINDIPQDNMDESLTSNIKIYKNNELINDNSLKNIYNILIKNKTNIKLRWNDIENGEDIILSPISYIDMTWMVYLSVIRPGEPWFINFAIIVLENIPQQMGLVKQPLIDNASISSSGLMSSANYNKLHSIEDGATKDTEITENEIIDILNN